MTFNPAQPFEVVGSAGGAAGFDPAQPFETVQPAASGFDPNAPFETVQPASAPSRLGVNIREAFRGTGAGETTERFRAGQVAGEAARQYEDAATRIGPEGTSLPAPAPRGGVPTFGRVAPTYDLTPEELAAQAAPLRAEQERQTADFNTRVLPERRAEEAALPHWNTGSIGDRVAQGGTALLGQVIGSMLSPESFIGPAGARGAMQAGERVLPYVGRQAVESGLPNAAAAAAVDPVVQTGEIERGTRQEYDPLATAFAAALGGAIGTGLPVSVETARNAFGFIARRRAAVGQPPPRMDGSDITPEERESALREFSEDAPTEPGVTPPNPTEPGVTPPRALPAPESEYVGRGEVPLRPVQDVAEPPMLAAPPRLLEAPEAEAPRMAPEEPAPPITPDPESMSGFIQPRAEPMAAPENPLPGRVATDVVPGRAAGQEPPPAGVRPVGEGPDVRVDQAQPQQGAPDAAAAAPMPPARSPDPGQTNVQPEAPRAGAAPVAPRVYRDRAEFQDLDTRAIRARRVIERLTQTGEPAAGTPPARQLEKARATVEARRIAVYDPEGTYGAATEAAGDARRDGGRPEEADRRAPGRAEVDGVDPGARSAGAGGGRVDAQNVARGNAAERPREGGDAQGAVDRGGGGDAPAVPARVLADRDGDVPGARGDDVAPAAVRVDDPSPRSDDAGASRPAGDDAPAEGASRGGEDPAADRGEAPPLYSTPLDPAAIKRFLTDPITNTARATRNRLRATDGARGFSTLFDSNRGALFVYRDRYPNSQALAKLIDNIATDPGSGRVVKGTYQTEVTSHAVGLTNRAVNVLGKATDADRLVRDALATGRTANPEVAVKASRIRKLLDEQRAYMRKAGVEVGEQKNYFPREYDEHAIAANQNDFIRDAEAEYAKTGLGTTEAHNAAVAFYERVTRVTAPGWTPDTIGPTSTKARVLPPSADDALARYMITDPRDVLARYFLRTTREAEFTRRFGKNGAEVTKWFEQMRRDGIPHSDVEEVKGHFASSVGALSRPGSSALQTAGDWIQTAGILKTLTGATIASLPEALAVGVRTGNPLRGIQALGNMFQSASKNADKARARQVAEWYGVIGTHGPDAVLASQTGVEARPGTMPSRINDGLFKLNMLHQLTQNQRTVATKHGMLFVKQMAEDVANNTRTRRSAEILLADMGMSPDDARAVHAWLKTNPDMPTMAGDSPEAQSYRTAVTRFVNETIQSPEPVDKPKWASHPVGRLAYGITSFQYAYTRNVIMRVGKLASLAVTEKGLTLADRARLAGALPAMTILGLGAWGVSEARDKLGNRMQRREQEPWIQTIANLDRLGVFMNLSPLVNIAMSARYQSDPASRVVGPYVSNITSAIKALTGTLPQAAGGPNSPRTNNAENTLARTTYASVLAPSVIAALALAPMPAPVRAVAGLGAIAATRPDANRAFANAVAGPPTVRARTAGNRNPGRTLGR